MPPPSRSQYSSPPSPAFNKRLLDPELSQGVTAEASSSGRRTRAPSLKALEASGKLHNEGAQWLTKEKKEEQVRLKKELKEQRKAAAAGGLKTGEVLEALVVPSAAEPGRRPGGCSIEGGTRGSGDRRGARLSRANWRRLTPAEILQQAGGLPAADLDCQREAGTAANGISCDPIDGTTANTGVKGATTKRKKKYPSSRSTPRREPTTATAERECDDKPKQQWNAKGGEGDHGQKFSPDTEDRTMQKCHEDGGNAASGNGGGERPSADESECKFPSCLETATFGVNGAVRYW